MHIKIKINKETIGTVKTKNEAIAYLLSMTSEDVKYYSPDGIRTRIATILDIAREIIDWKTIKNETGFRKRILNNIEALKHVPDNKIVDFYFNMLLQFEGLSIRR